MPTKPKKERGFRITKPGLKIPHQKGRPKGTRLKRKFEETRLGFMLKYEAQLEYGIILQITPKKKFIEPDIILIESICSASDNTAFKKKKFQRYLDEYRECGIYCDRPKILTGARAEYYAKIRKNQIKEYAQGKRVQLKNIKR